MLSNAFSFLPTRDRDGVWKLLSDVSIVRYLKGVETKKARNERLGKPLQIVLDEKEIKLIDCHRFAPGKNIDDIVQAVDNVPVLIVEKESGKERLVGILTAFDLL